MRRKGKDVGDEVAFVVSETIPIWVLRLVSSAVFLVHSPDVIVLDGKKNKTVGDYLKKQFRGKASFVFVSLELR